MAGSLKIIKNRIRSIGNTKKVTRALEMISVSKLNSANNFLPALRNYYAKLDAALNSFFGNAGKLSSPFLREGNPGGKIVLCLITSDSGLCAAYNHNIIRVAEEFIGKCGKDKIQLVAVGKKGLTYFRKRDVLILDSYTELRGRYAEETAGKLASSLIEVFAAGQASQIYVAYTHYKSAMVYIPTINKLLSLDIPLVEDMPCILEPDKDRVGEELIPKYLSARTKLMLLEAFTCEHAARTIAMKTATDNAEELLEQLILKRNKIRQATITQDIMEVTSSCEALKNA
jgi:F-type H+-transporting ATPase subunit gamma